MNKNLIRFWLSASVILAIGAAPFLAGGDSRAVQQRQAHARTIAALSPAERDQLMRNYEEYQKMTSAQRETMRTIHREIENDRRFHKGELTKVMERFDTWLKTLEPYQRDQLYNAKSSAERIALMRELVRSQREQTADRATRGRYTWSHRSSSDSGFFRVPALDSQQLAKVMAELERRSAGRLTADQQSELKSLQGIKRYVRLLEMLKNAGLNSQPLLLGPPREMAEMSEEIETIIDDPDVREYVESDSRLPRPSRFAWILFKTLHIELFRQRRAAEKLPGRDELAAYLETLPAAEQSELLALEASDFQIDLRNEYLDSKGLAELPEWHLLNEVFTGHPRGFLRGERPDAFGRRDNDQGPPKGPPDDRPPPPDPSRPPMRRGDGPDRPRPPPGQRGPFPPPRFDRPPPEPRD